MRNKTQSCLERIKTALNEFFKFQSNKYIFLKEDIKNMKTSDTGIEFIKAHEGLRLAAYDDLQPHVSNPNPVLGTLTIGYGHIKDVYLGMTITEERAEEFLREDLSWAEAAVEKLFVDHGWNFIQDRFDALVSWVYNTGAGGLEDRSLIKRIDQLHQAEIEVHDYWNKYYITSKGVKLEGLVKRRKQESELYLEIEK